METKLLEREAIPQITDAEREVADLLSIEVPPAEALATRDAVPLWFHTFALNRAESIYTPGIARDHRYRLPAIPESFAGERVLDIGSFDGFYAFLAEARGAERVVAVDNEQYVDWVRARFDCELGGGDGFRAVAGLLDSGVEYVRRDAFEVDQLGERFDTVICFGILHRVEDPVGLLRALHDSLDEGGRIILETYGSHADADDPSVRVHHHGDVYGRDEFVYWGFTEESLRRLGLIAGFAAFELVDAPQVAGHPRIIGELRRAS